MRTGDTYVSRDIDLGHIARYEMGNLAHRLHLHARTNHDDEIDLVPIVLLEPHKELIWQLLAKECDVRLHDARFWNIVCAVRIIIVKIARSAALLGPI